MTIVRKLVKSSTDPVSGGFYTVKEAARLLNIAQPARVKDWLHGRKDTSTGPVLKRQYDPLSTAYEVGFWDLLEVRFVEHFRSQGISLQSLRKAAATARDVLKQQHPFALSKAQFITDRRAIFLQTAQQLNDTALLNLVTRQYAMYVVFEDVLDRGMSFDPGDGLAREWRPRVKEFPSIALNPIVAFGQPAVTPFGVPTSTIFKTWKAEQGSYAAVSEWYEIEESLARQAVEFEIGLPN